jgi:hypothetical protein
MIVHANVYDPSRPSLFGNNKNDKAQCQTIECSNSENCDLFKRGECAIRKGLLGGECPYGKWQTETGYTRRAKRFHGWISERKERCEGVGYLKAPKRLGIVGDFVYLPYSHINKDGGLFSASTLFMPVSEFTCDKIKELCLYRPEAIMGGEITSYQKEVVPLFILHLSEIMPELYRELCDAWPRAKKIVEKHSNVGRKALLSTVVPNVGVLTGIHRDDWVWDGEYLTMTNKEASSMLVKHSEVRIKPVDGETVKICSEDQVNEKTVFVD